MLHNGTTFWNRISDKLIHSRPLEGSIICDVLVVGGGMSGALSAYVFSKAGYDTVLIDRAEAGEGSTAANTGLLQFSSDKSLHESISDFGAEKGVNFYRASFEGLKFIEQIVKELPGDTGFAARKSLYYASTEDDTTFLKKEYETLAAHGFSVEYLDATVLCKRYGIRKPAALLTSGDAEINPYAFVQSLLKNAVEKYGLRIHEHTEFISWQKSEKENNFLVQTGSNGEIRCGYVIYAPGYAEDSVTAKVKGNSELVRSYALVTEPVEEEAFWPGKVMIWETERPYLYLRHAPGNRIIIGGLDEATKVVPSEKHILHQAGKLMDKLQKLFPRIKTRCAACWGARFGATDDGLPFIGSLSDHPEFYLLLGYGGNGTVYSAIGAQILLDLAEKKINPYADIFKVDRVKKKS